MENFQGRESTSETVGLGPSQRAARQATPEKPLYVPFPVVLVQDGKVVLGRSSAVAVAVVSLGEAVAARRRASRAGEAAVRPSRTRRSAEMW